MILHLRTTHPPATDLGFLLHKHPAKLQSFDLSFGRAHVFYPVATAEQCQATLLVEVDPVSLARGKRDEASLEPYVNDRPYAASSFLAVAIAEVFSSALNGHSKDRPELARTPLPLEAELPVLSAPGIETLERLFAPLGYNIEARRLPLDSLFPDWGESRYFHVTLKATMTLQNLLRHLYVLIPALDARKHYFVGQAEVEKLLAKGEGWIAEHPEKPWIVRRYLRERTVLMDEALRRLDSLENAPVVEAETSETEESTDDDNEPILNLHEQRHAFVVALAKQLQVQSFADLGCGDGKLLRRLLVQTAIPRLLGMDVSSEALLRADRRFARRPEAQRQRVEIILGSLLYRDQRLAGFDLAALIEVIEHLEPARLKTMERVVFEFAQPRHVVITTPNADYNIRFPTLTARTFRHADHRFEWTRAEFQTWADAVALRHGYRCAFHAIGTEADSVGAPTQAAHFTRT